MTGSDVDDLLLLRVWVLCREVVVRGVDSVVVGGGILMCLG